MDRVETDGLQELLDEYVCEDCGCKHEFCRCGDDE